MFVPHFNVVDDDLAHTLKISEKQKEHFTYYTFAVSIWSEYWNIFGLHTLNDNPLLVDVRLMNIDQDLLDTNDFVAERDAPGYILCAPDTYPSIIVFFEMIVGKAVADHGEPLHHFHRVTRDQMRQFHYPHVLMDESHRYYLYNPGKGVQNSEWTSLLFLPRWSAQYGSNQVQSLWFITVSQQQLMSLHFNLTDDADGLGTIRFDQEALEEFVILLKRHMFR